jgi:nucleoside-diphosphate-sugar epimerase
VRGRLEDGDALRHLARGAVAVIHVAGVISAPDAAGFEAGNVAGTVAMLEAAKAEDVPRFVHISSLAAREPQLSMYGASKARSEVRVNASGLSHAVVRPPAVYGPGDRETLELFKMAKRGLVLLPPRGRISLIHVDDLAQLLLALSARQAPSGLTVEPDDGRAGGWSHEEFARALGRATGREKPPLTLQAPVALLNAGAFIDRLVRGTNAKLTPDRAAYFAHPDWVASPALGVPTRLWAPRIATEEGLAATARWYEDRDWL